MKLSTSIFRSLAPVAFSAMSLHALGCLAGPSESGLTEEDFLGSAELGVGGDPGTTNHYDVGCFLDHVTQQWLRNRGVDPLVDQHGFVSGTNALDAAVPKFANVDCRRQMIELVAECALGSSQSVSDSTPSGEITTMGRLGYASQWTSRALTRDEKELVTACMLQRLNPYGVVIPVLLEQPDAQDATTDYDYRESEAWGNLFDSTVPLNPTKDPAYPYETAFAAYSCKINSQPRLCTVSGSVVPWSPVNHVIRACYFNDEECKWIALGGCTEECVEDPNYPEACNAWGNRLRTRARDDGSLCQPRPGY